MPNNDKCNKLDDHNTAPNAIEPPPDPNGARVPVASTPDIASSLSHDLTYRQRRRLTSKKRRQLSNLDSNAKTTTIDDNHDNHDIESNHRHVAIREFHPSRGPSRVVVTAPAGERFPPAVPEGALELRKTELVEHSSLKAPEATGSSELAAAPGGICTGQPHIDPGRFLPESQGLSERRNAAEIPVRNVDPPMVSENQQTQVVQNWLFRIRRLHHRYWLRVCAPLRLARAKKLLAVLPPALKPRARGECCGISGGNILVENLGPENGCKNVQVIDLVDNSTVSDDHIAAADDFTGAHDSAIDFDGTSNDSEFEVGETQFQISVVGAEQ